MIVFVTIHETQMYDHKRNEQYKLIHHEPFGEHLNGSFSLHSNQHDLILLSKLEN